MWILRRLLELVIVILATATITFALLRAAPGDPIDALSAGMRQPTPERRAALAHELGLDRPAPVALALWCAHALVLDFGHSSVDGRAVTTRVAEALLPTVLLVLLTLAWAYTAGIAIALWRRPATLIELVIGAAYALPVAGVGALLLLMHAPYGGRLALVPASLALGLSVFASVGSQQRAALRVALAQPFVVVHAARGVDERGRVWRALATSLGPTFTLLGSHLPSLLSGALVVEVMFGVPGIGRLFVQSMWARDVAMVLGLVTLSTATAVVAGWLADALVRRVDPRQAERA